MNRQEFFNRAMAEILEQLPKNMRKGVTLTMNSVLKCNDIELHGVSLKKGSEDISPNIYLDNYYERFENGEPMKDLMQEVTGIFTETERPEGMPQPKDIPLDYSSIKDKLTFRLLEMKRNRMYLVNTPYMPVGNGLALVCDVKLKSGEDGEWRTTITKDMMEKYGYDKRQLFLDGLKNVQNVDPPVMMDMQQNVFGLGADNVLDKETGAIEKSNMYVLSNKSGVLGASVLFYPEIQEKVSEKIGEGYYVLPSSLHEVIVVPESAGFDAKGLTDMVRDANSSVVDAKDILSDNVYHFDMAERKLETAHEPKALGDRVSEGRS